MSTPSSPRRRRRSEMEDDESPPRLTPTSSDSSKRARINGIDRDTPTESSDSEDAPTGTGLRRSTLNSVAHGRSSNELGDADDVEAGKFQPGAIVRVKLINFITYANAEFFPGPNLNMVIGPNGTGKSSLVCAICLGLGWNPNVLGRASNINEFVKHNSDAAFVEIELQRRDNEPQNHIVRLKIIRDGNGREWFLNGRKTSLKAVQTLTKSLSIQIDNLCQFLPQDKVSEFAALSPVELLLQTQRAAAPEQMLEWHEELKSQRREQKQYEDQLQRDEEHLESLETRQDNLRAEVQRLEERNQIQNRVHVLKKTVPFVEYREARDEHIARKEEKKEAQRRLRDLRKQVGPTLESINHKEEYAGQIRVVINERKEALQTAEKTADDCLRAVEKMGESVQKLDQEINAEREAEKTRKNDYAKLERKVSDLKARANEPEPSFNSPEFNERIRSKESEKRRLENEEQDIKAQYKELETQARRVKAETDTARDQLERLSTHEGQQMNKLQPFSKDTALAWEWVQAHQGNFEKEIYGPPVITCSIKDPRYTDVVEALLGKQDFLCLTAQTPADAKKLQNHVLGTMRLGDVGVRTVSQTLSVLNQPTMSSQELQQCGLEGWALQYIDGPEPVLAMLCGSKKLHAAGISLQDITEDQHRMLTNSRCSSWVAGKSINKVSRRTEYGSGASSTITNTIKSARWWTDAPVDTSVRREIEARISTLKQTMAKLREQRDPIKEKGESIVRRKEDISNEIRTIQKEKADLQKIHGEWSAVPRKLAQEEDFLKKKDAQGKEIRERIKNFLIQCDMNLWKKANKALDHKGLVEAMRRFHVELVDAKIRLIEAESDIEALKERNRDIVERLQLEEDRVQTVERASQDAKNRANAAMRVVQEIRAEAEAVGNLSDFQNIPSDLTKDALERDIEAEESKLDYIHANNPNAIRDFERRQIEVDKVKSKITEAKNNLEKLARSIKKVRGKWEPELDKLIAEISDAFSHNFEQIGCAGEVSVHKDEDFDQWSIEIKVKFRENETLQILDQHRQSGGERSVSTIFYLMSLQSLARSPFRVVDEINQGMDPRNERMVHERMVEIACKEHTSQYFLITPKLLTNLRYDKRMKVHCIASGEHMPEDHTKMDVQKIIAMRRTIVAAA